MITSKQVDLLRKVEFGETVNTTNNIMKQLIKGGYVFLNAGYQLRITPKGAAELRKHPGAPEASEVGGT